MVLSEDCDVTMLQTLADQRGLKFNKIFTVNGWWEKNVVYKIVVK